MALRCKACDRPAVSWDDHGDAWCTQCNIHRVRVDPATGEYVEDSKQNQYTTTCIQSLDDLNTLSWDDVLTAEDEGEL